MSFPFFFMVSLAYLAFLPFADFFGDQLTFAVAFCPRLVTTAFFSRIGLAGLLHLLGDLGVAVCGASGGGRVIVPTK